jgi:hypothetical protein
VAEGKIIEFAPTDAPVIDAYEVEGRDGVRQVTFFCDWCATWHRHGGGRERKEAEGHRVEHCWLKDGPYAATGYVLRVVGPMTQHVRDGYAVAERQARADLKRRLRDGTVVR